jgi:hypothetical protein
MRFKGRIASRHGVLDMREAQGQRKSPQAFPSDGGFRQLHRPYR